MSLITKDDFVETYSKLYQKGIAFWLSRLHPDPIKRTTATFDLDDDDGSFWWMIPAVRRRMNRKITGDEGKVYEQYFSEQYLQGRTGLRLLSLGCGTCSHEIRFAEQSHFAEVMCVDITPNILKEAEAQCRKKGLGNIQFRVVNVNSAELPGGQYDVVLFNSSLHHFQHVDALLAGKVYNALKDDGLLLVNEYVGADRLQFPRAQVAAMNDMLRTIPAGYRRRYKSGLIKKSITGPGLLRMLLTDPSECVESGAIIPSLHKHYQVLEEKPVGGNLLMLVYKDIAHHFFEENDEKKAILEQTFAMEDLYLQHNPADIVFGVYRKKEH